MSFNCSLSIPISDVYFSEILLWEKIAVGICAAMCLGVLVLFIDKAYFVISHYHTSNPEIKIKCLWLVGIYPIFAVAALLAIFVPRAALLCDLVSSVYLAVCLVHFNSLIILYSGGAQKLLEKVKNTGFNLRTPPCCCCCICCPTIDPTGPNLKKMQLMVLQTSFLQPFISFVTIVLWLDEKYTMGEISFTKAYLYLAIANAVSTLVAMYGLLVLFRSVRIFLKRHSIAQKFVVLQLVLIFHNLQGFIFETLAKKNIPSSNGCLSSTVRSKALQHMILVAEMFLLAFMARILYRKPHAEEFDLENDNSGLDNSHSSADNGWRRTQGAALEGYEQLPGDSSEEHKTP